MYVPLTPIISQPRRGPGAVMNLFTLVAAEGFIRVRGERSAKPIYSSGSYPPDVFKPQITGGLAERLLFIFFLEAVPFISFKPAARRDSMKDNGLPAPVIDTGDPRFSIAFPRVLQNPAERDVPLNGASNVPLNVPLNEKIIHLICENPGMQRKALAVSLDVTEKTVGRYLLELIAERRVEHRGSKKTGGYWAL